MIQSRNIAQFAVATTLSLFAGITANADEVSFDFSQDNGTHSASANFTFADGAGDLGTLTSLTITLTNTMTTNSGPQWLTGLFFDMAGSPTMSYQSVNGQMITLDGITQSTYNDAAPDHFWAYRDDLSGLPFGDQEYGLGSAGFGVFGQNDILNWDPNGPQPQPDGTDGGILADISGLEVPNGHEGTPFVLGSLQLTFWLPEGFSLDDADVSDVAFVFGTDFDEVVLIPLPLPLAMAAAGFGIVAVFRRRLTALAGV